MHLQSWAAESNICSFHKSKLFISGLKKTNKQNKKIGQTSQRLAGPNTVYCCINKYRFIHFYYSSFYVKSPLNTEKDRDTVITGIQEKTIISLVPNCTGSQARPLCLVHVSGGSTDPPTLPFRGSASNAAVPIGRGGGRGRQQTSQPVESRWVIGWRLSMLSLGRK